MPQTKSMDLVLCLARALRIPSLICGQDRLAPPPVVGSSNVKAISGAVSSAHLAGTLAKDATAAVKFRNCLRSIRAIISPRPWLLRIAILVRLRFQNEENKKDSGLFWCNMRPLGAPTNSPVENWPQRQAPWSRIPTPNTLGRKIVTEVIPF